MKFIIKAKPGAKKESVREVREAEGLFPPAASVAAAARAKAGVQPQFIVAVKEPPKDGKANRAIERALAEYFNVPPSRVRIVSGHASRENVVEITGR